MLGSRWVPGGRVENWPRRRSCSPAAATPTPGWPWASRSATPPAATGPSAGTALEALDLDDVASQGYCFQVDLAWRAVQRGLRVVEVPITFVERERGDSKMSGSIVREALLRVTAWGVKHRISQIRGLTRRRSAPAEAGRP